MEKTDKAYLSDSGEFKIEGNIHTQMDGQFWAASFTFKLDDDLNIIEKEESSLKSVFEDRNLLGKANKNYFYMAELDYRPDNNWSAEFYICMKDMIKNEIIWRKHIKYTDRNTLEKSIISANGDLIFAVNVRQPGYSSDDPRQSLYLTRINNKGEFVWTKDAKVSDYEDEITSIIESKDGNLFLTGATKGARSGDASFYAWVRKIKNAPDNE